LGTIEIRDQRYDEKQNRVLISVVSCCPERILEKIASKGGKTVESIKIVPEKKDSEKPKETEKKKNVGDEPKEGKTKDARAAGKPEEGKKMKGGGGDKHKGDGEKKEDKKLKETEKKNVGDKPKEGKAKKDARAAEKPEEGKKKKDGGGDKRKGDGEKQQAQGQNIIIIKNVNIYQDRRHYQLP